MNPMPDEEIKTIRQIRHQISVECGHDVDRVVAYYRAVEDELRRSGEFGFAEVPDRSPRGSKSTHPLSGRAG
jgi:hypothetical protein